MGKTKELLNHINENCDNLVITTEPSVYYIENLLAKKNIKFYAIDAYNLVNELGLQNKISTCMEICIFYILGIRSILRRC